ncbi:MAG: DUF4149 domain-containing protein [Candidatus Heimdallarchaeota archaeon]|nr:DUF4149 domain-containing protein [Candidatus Heimdallarchaeota archaeon]
MSFDNIIIDWIHLVASTAWIGGLIFINLVFQPVVNQLDPKERGKANQLMGKYFARLAGISGVALVITGLMNLPEGISWSDVNDTGDYGTFLNIKLVVVILMFAIGFYVPFVLSPKMIKLAPKEGEKPSEELLKTADQITLIGRVNMGLGILLLFFAATLLNGAQF